MPSWWKCQGDEMSSWWNVEFMKCRVYEMSSLWNVEFMKCPVYEMSSLWNVKLMKKKTTNRLTNKMAFWHFDEGTSWIKAKGRKIQSDKMASWCAVN